MFTLQDSSSHQFSLLDSVNGTVPRLGTRGLGCARWTLEGLVPD